MLFYFLSGPFGAMGSPLRLSFLLGARCSCWIKLKRRGRALANKCFLCGVEEIIDHILHPCLMARMPWDLFLAIVGASWVFPFSVRETLLSWIGSLVGKRRRRMWTAAPLCIFLDNLA